MRGKRMNCLKSKEESTRKKKRRRKRWRLKLMNWMKKSKIE
jgi:hypothetical protein